MDRIGVHLAFCTDKGGHTLACHKLMKYYWQVKEWLVERFSAYGAQVEKALLK